MSLPYYRIYGQLDSLVRDSLYAYRAQAERGMVFLSAVAVENIFYSCLCFHLLVLAKKS